MPRSASQYCCCQHPCPMMSHCQPIPPEETLQHWWVGLVQYPVGSLLLSLGSLRRQEFVCALQEWRASLVAQTVKNLPARDPGLGRSLGEENEKRREWLPTPVFLPGEFHGQRNLAGYSSGGHKELIMTDWITLQKWSLFSPQSCGNL